MTFLGCDPEVFVTKNGVAVPAHAAGVPPKWQKKTENDFGTGYFRDGTQVEMNTKPSTTVEGLIASLDHGYRVLRHDLGADYSLSSEAAVRIDPPTFLKDAPADAVEFGCNPSFDAYSLRAKMPEVDPLTLPIRMAGGHMHIATDDIECQDKGDEDVLKNPSNYPDVVKEMDRYIGTWAAFIYDDPMQWERRRIYGQAGEFRPQNYGPSKDPNRGEAMGVEYRTPPPAIFNSPETISVFYNIARWLVRNFREVHAKYDAHLDSWVQEAINEGKNVRATAKRFTVPGLMNEDIALGLKRHNALALGL